MKHKPTVNILIILWVLISGLLMMSWFTPLAFTHPVIAKVLATILLVCLPFILGLLVIFKRARLMKLTLIFLPIFLIIVLFADRYKWSGPFKTQTILYQQVSNPDTRIAFQMASLGAFGYKRRVVKIISLAPFIQWVTPVDTNSIDTAAWIRVNEHVNELHLKGG
jgi:hypothetical protein